MAGKRKRNYVNNPDFLAAIVEYRKQCEEAENAGEEHPVIPDYIGQCIMQISNRLATKPNFSGYPFKEDMIMDGIENCIKYIHKFDPEKSDNPFAYFTRVIWNAFLRRIASEKKQMYVKFKSSHETVALQDTYDGGAEVSVNLNVSPDYMNAFVEDFEDKNFKKKGKK